MERVGSDFVKLFSLEWTFVSPTEGDPNFLHRAKGQGCFSLGAYHLRRWIQILLKDIFWV